MKKIFAFLTLCLVAITASAQQKADIEVSYTQTNKGLRGGITKTEWTLLANSSLSKFYNRLSERIDSMCSTPKGKKEYDALMFRSMSSGKASMAKPSNLYVLISNPKSEVEVYGKAVDNHYRYSEPFDEMSWEMTDSVRSVLGYECSQAKTMYHGRTWIAWFTPEIPVSTGPWKFRGLPGIILEAYDSDKDYCFVATGMEKSTEEIRPVYSKDQYEKSDRKAMLRLQRKFIENPMARIEAQFGKIAEIDGPGFPEIPDGWDYPETDYR